VVIKGISELPEKRLAGRAFADPAPHQFNTGFRVQTGQLLPRLYRWEAHFARQSHRRLTGGKEHPCAAVGQLAYQALDGNCLVALFRRKGRNVIGNGF
jgi:hypothetical protein